MYELYYYQHDPSRISACPVTIHALLHIADSIEDIGPVWTSWAFAMERFCGDLQPAIKSRRFPWACIDNHLLAKAQITQIRLIYDNVSNAFPLVICSVIPNALSGADTTCVFSPPRKPFVPDQELRKKILGALSTRLGRTNSALVKKHTPMELIGWGRVRIRNEGDTLHAYRVQSRTRDARDATFVRYEVLVDKNKHKARKQPSYELQTFYGRLEYVVQVNFDTQTAQRLGLDVLSPDGAVVALAAVLECAIERSHSRLDIHFYRNFGSISVVDLSCVQCVVGRVWDPEAYMWGIVDRSGSLSRALVVVDE
ncbi:uncharacterized protein BXZ73DRAFT_57295 [Epithele typhae]|uniref:uncharacterized protein n=1 Tax=Epithele typhae TaxID=378194 RepID=UPI002007AC41|nr:uncharacterized protein BXZ73DRAFT_57295 [Epithele typhae]KAH9911173.1 hypothetical protein BXZ73DRAFT_57295 [Epithele typhae]